ncbi:MAG: 30S ribosome-binding factor RbfA [Candidatus Gracilibacteria bacterium]|nr:30S ribosome-binding factor RbfA [Candidatus Gracilibacteria bacterium]MDQ7022785.1 30S ribosome-binding factor RbfA [Candidatus Gracilibacteria bacterium]
MSTERLRKVEKIIRNITSDFISKELPDEDNVFGIINISEIELSSDYGYVDILVSSFIKQDLLTKTLAKSAYIIQKHIGKKIGLRKSPKVRFRYDDSGETGAEINTVISGIDKEIRNLESKNPE